MSDDQDAYCEEAKTYTPEQSSNSQASIRFEDISQGEQEVLVEYRGQLYRLRATKNGKLILNK